MRQERNKRSWTPSVLAGLLVVGVLVAGWFIAAELREFREAQGDGAALAEAELDRRATRYAEAVLAVGDPVPDDRLRTLAADHDVQLWQTRREPELSLVIEASEGYGRWPQATLQLCHRLDFRALGTPDAGFDLVRLPSCPTPPTP
ncbi:hypothetical protein [Micromonospora lutea]|uniref:Flp pilus-assembly TadG-like N-terminal domain-containing protein n=1 Tax=Micromonospora lutea TaxID=419825 RepID=A0ABQ4IVJ1_9ACTN|nr:hypothetical protein [Micromonospora lutea]GIJ21922.1 hypothetical protein Vlu01_25460 [Micromonospora lutea]